MRVTALAALLGLAFASGASAQSLALTGPDGASRTVTASDLAAMPHQQALLRTEDGRQIAYQGVPLTLLLQTVGAPAGKTLRGRELADIVVVSASDGYRVALALADTDPAMTDRPVVLADRT
jgi:hypothetical protein